MNKKDVEDILISMKHPNNEEIIDKLLNKVRIIDDDSLQNAITKAGGTKENITKFFEAKISERQTNTQEHISINEMFTYGVTGNCIHLHLPSDLHLMISERGISKTIDTINLYLIDAIDKIKDLKDNGYDKFRETDSIYMISPILLRRELNFLNSLDFQTRTYKKEELNSEDFIKDNAEAELAIKTFGKDKNVGTAQIKFELISSEKWQKKKEEKIKEFTSKGITFIQRQQQLSKRVYKKDIEKLEKIGEGKCANIYKNGNVVYKILKENSDSRSLYSKEMLQHLVGIENDLCVFPNEILEDNNGNLLGYSMYFVPGEKMKDVIGMLSFKQIQDAIENAKQSIKTISNQGILFDDMHADNVMWNKETQSIQIIDTDFFKKVDNIPNLNDINYQKFSNTIRHMIDERVYQYGRTVNEELIPFYDRTRLSSTKDGKPLPIDEYLLNLKSVIEKDFGVQFDNLNEMEMALQEKQFKAEEQQHLEEVANNLTIKERFIRFLAHSKYIRKIPFVNNLINNKIKMLPQDVQKVVNKPINNNDFAESEQVEERNEANQGRKEFTQELTNWIPTEQEHKNNITDEIEDKAKNRNESDDLML